MGCNSYFRDKYDELDFLIEEFNQILFYNKTNKYTCEEQSILDSLKYKKKQKIEILFKEINYEAKTELQFKKLIILTEEYEKALEGEI